MTGGIRYLFAAMAMGIATVSYAQPAKDPPKFTDLDKLAVDVLRDIHNRGAELYNRGDPAGCYRMYEAALVTVRPFLAHRPKTLKTLDDGLAEVAKSPDGVKVQAFRLHEVIEQIRADLKGKDKKADTEAKKAKPLPQAPPPKKKSDSPAGKDGTITGEVTLDGKPLAVGELTLVSLDLPLPRVFTTKVTDGKYVLTDKLPTGTYVVTVSGKGLPRKFQSTLTSELRVQAAGGPNEFNLDLKSK